MPQLLEYLPLKALGQSLRASFRKLPFKSDAGSLVPDGGSMETEAEPNVADDPSALETRVMEILRLASQMQPGPLRRDALAEVKRLRQRAVELHRRNAADLRARIAARRPSGRPHLRPISEATNLATPSAGDPSLRA